MENWKDMQNLTALLSEDQKAQLAGVESQIGIRCLLDIWLNFTNSKPDGLFCNGTWDNYYCWPPAQAGTVVTLPCSEAFKLGFPDHAYYLEGNATRICLENGTWSQGNRTNYDECAKSFEANGKPAQEMSVVVVVQYVLFIGSILSLACLTASLGIFAYFKCLRCDRVTVNIHLMIALVIRFILLVVITWPFVLNRATSYRDVDTLCKGIIIVYLYGTVTSVAWMFIQGLYINTNVITVVPTCGVPMQRQLKLYYFIGWVIPAVLLIIYTGLMATRQKQPWCWKGYASTDEMYYILLMPMLIATVLNAGFILNTGRIVYRKGQRSRSQGERSQLKDTARAMVILFFVLGVNNLIVAYDFDFGEMYYNVFIVTHNLLGSIQGIIVSLLYCFTNKDVKEATKRCFNRIMTNSAFRGSEGRLPQQFSLCVFPRQSVERDPGTNSPVSL